MLKNVSLTALLVRNSCEFRGFRVSWAREMLRNCDIAEIARGKTHDIYIYIYIYIYMVTGQIARGKNMIYMATGQIARGKKHDIYMVTGKVGKLAVPTWTPGNR